MHSRRYATATVQQVPVPSPARKSQVEAPSLTCLEREVDEQAWKEHPTKCEAKSPADPNPPPTARGEDNEQAWKEHFIVGGAGHAVAGGIDTGARRVVPYNKLTLSLPKRNLSHISRMERGVHFG